MTTRALAIALGLGLGCGGGSSQVAPAAAKTPAAASAASATAVGAVAPDVQLTTTKGTRIAFADVLHQHARTVVVFYRGFW